MPLPSISYPSVKKHSMEEQKAKYRQIITWIKARIVSGELTNGAKLNSEHELVSIFNVSRQTVRHAIAVLENEGLVNRRRGSGTYIRIPVKLEKENEKTMRIAIITTYVDEYIFPPIISEVERTLSREGYIMQIAFTNNEIEKERYILKSILDNKAVDGIIAETTKSGLPSPNLPLYRKIMQKGIPIIFLNSYYQELRAPHVSMDDKAAGKIVTEHLLKCGHRKIAGVFKADDGQGHQRYAGYVEALMEADIKVKGERIVWFDTEELRCMKEEAGRMLKRLQGCTACVCYNDEVANKMVGICIEQGIRIPEDISIVGIDNSDLANLCEVPLTSVENPVRDLGRIAAREIIELINGKEQYQNFELKPNIVVRKSVRMIDHL